MAGLKRYIIDNNLIDAQKKFVVVISGANMNFDRLRFVAERAELGEGREALLSVDIPERPGRSLSTLELNETSSDGFPSFFFIPQLQHLAFSDPSSCRYRIRLSI